jgi:hypothetical protein
MPERSPAKDTLWWAVIGIGACASAVGLALVLVSCAGSLNVGEVDDDDAVGDDDDAVGDDDDDAVGDDDDAIGDDDAVGDDDDTTPPEDADGDGYTEAQGDCDDNDDTAYPGALETNGDGVDSNCDGLDDLVPGENCYSDDNVIGVPGFVEFTLWWNDETGGPAGHDYNFDDVEFIGVAGDTVHISMWDQEWELDPYLFLLDPTCSVVAEADDGADPDDDDSYLEYTLPAHGIYTIIATSANPWEVGDYELEIW